MTPQRWHPQQGQALLECLLGLPLVIAMVSVIFALSYRAVVFYLVDYQLHEALICTDDEMASHCRDEFVAKVRPYLLLGEHMETRLTRGSQHAQGSVLITTENLSNALKYWPRFQIEKKISFPLRKS